MDKQKFDDSFKGCFSNNLIAGFDFTETDPIVYMRADGTIIANMDGCAIMPKIKYLELTGEKNGDNR